MAYNQGGLNSKIEPVLTSAVQPVTLNGQYTDYNAFKTNSINPDCRKFGLLTQDRKPTTAQILSAFNDNNNVGTNQSQIHHQLALEKGNGFKLYALT